MKRIVVFLLSFVLAASAVSCRNTASVSRTVFALDTYCSVTAYGVEDSALDEVQALLSSMERQYSATLETSLVSQINAGKSVELPVEMLSLLALAQRVTQESEGAFDVSVFPLVEAYGYYSDEYRVPTEGELQEKLKLVDGYHLLDSNGKLALLPGQKLDLGAIAKGHIADCCLERLKEQGAQGAILSFGGNVAAFGTKPDSSLFTVAIADPEEPESFLGTMQLEDASLVTAGAYQRGFEKDGVYYHHIIDPKTGKPADSGVLSATVLCKKAARADALSTACFVLGKEGALRLWRASGDFELVLVTEDGVVLCTEGLEGNFRAENRQVEFVKKNAENA